MSLPGVGKKTCERLLDIREAHGNVTLDQFLALGLRATPFLLELLDFTPWEPKGEAWTAPDPIPITPRRPHEGPFTEGEEDWEDEFDRRVDPDDDFLRRVDACASKLRGPPSRYKGVAHSTPNPHPPNRDTMRPEPPIPEGTPSRTGTGKSGTSLEGRGEQGAVPKTKPTPIMKTIMFDGKKSWKSFIIKFTSYAQSQGWSTSEMKNNLCWSLDDKASDFYARLVERDPHIEYSEILERMQKRFDLKELPETTQVKFSLATQGSKEPITEWADRVVTLATMAYPDLTDKQIYKQAILRFCQGCRDKQAGHYAVNQRPSSMEVAVDRVQWYKHTEQIMVGCSSAGVVREARVAEPESSDRLSRLEAAMSGVESKLDSVISNIEKMASIMVKSGSPMYPTKRDLNDHGSNPEAEVRPLW